MGRKKKSDVVVATTKVRLDFSLFGDRFAAAVDGIILDGFGAEEVLKLLAAKYRGPMAIPSVAAIEEYLSTRGKILFDNVDERNQAIIALKQNLDLRLIDVRNTRSYNIARLSLLSDQIMEIAEANRHLNDVEFYNVFAKMNDTVTSIQLAQKTLENRGVLEVNMFRAVAQVVLQKLSKAILDQYETAMGAEEKERFSKILDIAMDSLDYDDMVKSVERILRESVYDEVPS